MWIEFGLAQVHVGQEDLPSGREQLQEVLCIAERFGYVLLADAAKKELETLSG